MHLVSALITADLDTMHRSVGTTMYLYPKSLGLVSHSGCIPSIPVALSDVPNKDTPRPRPRSNPNNKVHNENIVDKHIACCARPCQGLQNCLQTCPTILFCSQHSPHPSSLPLTHLLLHWTTGYHPSPHQFPKAEHPPISPLLPQSHPAVPTKLLLPALHQTPLPPSPLLRHLLLQLLRLKAAYSLSSYSDKGAGSALIPLRLRMSKTIWYAWVPVCMGSAGMTSQ